MIELFDGLAHFGILAAKTPEEQRYLYYSHSKFPKKASRVNYLEEGDKLFYSESIGTIHFNQKLYIRHTNKRGFTFDKSTGKLNMWFKGDINQLLHLNKLFIALGHEWVINEKIMELKPTKTQVQNILNGRITNPTEFCRKFLSGNRIKHLSPEVLRKQIKKSSNPSINKHHLLRAAAIYKDLNHYYERADSNPEDIFSPMSTIISDMEQQAMLLGEKIDARWSDLRMKEVHTEWTRRIMEIEEKSIDEKIYVENIPELPPYYRILATRKTLFREGMEMHHCIFTNYEYNVSNGDYLAIAYKDASTRATIGIRLKLGISWSGESTLVPKIDQAYGPRNKSLSPEIIEQFEQDLIRNKEVSNWLSTYFQSRRDKGAKAPVEEVLDFDL